MSYHCHSSVCFQNLLKPSQSWYIWYPAQPFRAQHFQAWKHLHDFHSNFLPAAWSLRSCKSRSPRQAPGLSAAQHPLLCREDRSPVSLATTASLARKVALIRYKSFPSLLPRALFYSCKGPQICTNWSHVKAQFSRSMSSVSTVTTVQIVQVKYTSHAGPRSQPHLLITWPRHHHHGKEDSLWLVPWSAPRGCPGNCAPVGLAAQGGPANSVSHPAGACGSDGAYCCSPAARQAQQTEKSISSLDLCLFYGWI